MLRHYLSALLLCLALAAPVQASAAANGNWTSSPQPTGRWITASHDAVIQIAPCGADLCGWIAGIVLGPHDPIPRDWAGGSQCGLTIIKVAPGTDDDGQTVYNGTIVDPRDGSAYHARIRIDAADNLDLRGFIGLPIFGRTQVWTPYTGPMSANCRL